MSTATGHWGHVGIVAFACTLCILALSGCSASGMSETDAVPDAEQLVSDHDEWSGVGYLSADPFEHGTVADLKDLREMLPASVVLPSTGEGSIGEPLKIAASAFPSELYPDGVQAVLEYANGVRLYLATDVNVAEADAVIDEWREAEAKASREQAERGAITVIDTDGVTLMAGGAGVTQSGIKGEIRHPAQVQFYMDGARYSIRHPSYGINSLLPVAYDLIAQAGSRDQ